MITVPANLYSQLEHAAEQDFRKPADEILFAVQKFVVDREEGSRNTSIRDSPLVLPSTTPSSTGVYSQQDTAEKDLTVDEAACEAQQQTFAQVKATGRDPMPHVYRVKTISGFRGVYPYGKRWIAKMLVLGKHHALGPFDDKLEAARAYDTLARNVHGAKALLNFPSGQELGCRHGTPDDEFCDRIALGTPFTPEERAYFDAKHTRQLENMDKRYYEEKQTISMVPTSGYNASNAAYTQEEIEAMVTSEAVDQHTAEDDPLMQEAEALPPAPDVEKLVGGMVIKRHWTRQGPPPGGKMVRGRWIPTPPAPDEAPGAPEASKAPDEASTPASAQPAQPAQKPT